MSPTVPRPESSGSAFEGVESHAAVAVADTAVPATVPLQEVPVAVGAGERADSRVGTTRAWTLTCLGVDAAMLLAGAIASQLGARAAGVPASSAPWLLLFALATIGLLQARGMYSWRLRLEALDDVRAVLIASTVAATAVLSSRVLLADSPDVAAQLLRLWAFSAVYLAAGRVALDWSQAKARRHGDALRPTLIVGAGKVGQLLAERLANHPELGLRPVGYLDKEPLAAASGKLEVPVLGASWDLEAVAAEHGVEQVLVTFSTAPSEVLLRLVKRCRDLGLDVAFVPRLYEEMTARLRVEHLGGLPLVSVCKPDPKGWQFAVKYALDRVLAAAAIVLLAPVLIGAAAAVWLSMGAPIFFRQLRIGRDGRPFEMLKFRSMRAPEAVPDEGEVELPPDTAPGGVEGDDRRTRAGQWLRSTSIDELPQLFNVLKGEMSMVGPRPERPQFVDRFEESVYRYGDRHRVKSGITGWAQVHGLRGKTSISDRAEWDNYYIENWSLWLDLKIMFMTLLAVVNSVRQVE